MRDSTTLFDHDADPEIGRADDLTREFWGESPSWVVRDRGHERTRSFQVQHIDDSSPALRLDHTPTWMRAMRDGLAAFRPRRRWRDDSTGPIERTREHGVVWAADTTMHPPGRRPSPERLLHGDASIADLAAGRYDGPRHRDAPTLVDRDLDETGLIELTPSRDTIADRVGLAGIDPLVVRLGIVLLALLLAVPLALSMRDERDPIGTTAVTVATAAGVTGEAEPAVVSETPTTIGPVDDAAVPAAPAAALADTIVSTNAGVGDLSTVVPVAEPPSTVDETVTPTTTDASIRAAPLTESEDVAIAVEEVATVSATAERSIPDCSLIYTAGAGDSWYRIADAADVTPAALLDQNRATTETVIFPGDEVCLPAGATMPAAPSTSTPATTNAPPTTTAPPVPASSAEVQAMIREIWPDQLEERALEIARLESNYDPTADNGWCCVGVFQIYWTVHRSWLDDYGIFTRDDLKNARKNITAAYALYQRSGDWGPWGF